MWWTKEKIGYYERAAESTDFHRILAAEIERHVGKTDRIVEFGAGLGYVTEIMLRDGYDIRAIEKEELPIRKATERAGFRFIDEGDAYSDIPEADVYLMIFFGRLAENGNLDHFLGKAGKRIISISGRHTGYSHSRKTDHTSDLPALLDERGIPYECVEIEAEFNQPLESPEDAERWFMMTYGNAELKELEQTGQDDYPLLFRNRKRMVMTIMDTEKGEHE